MSEVNQGSPFDHIITDIEDNKLDLEQRMVIAKGFLPLEPEVLASALLLLTNDPDREISKSARDTILEMPVSIVKNLALNRNTSPKLFHILAQLRIADTDLLEAIVLNPSVENHTLEYIARHGPTKVIEILAGNQERMLSYKPIIKAILQNTNTPSYIQIRLEMFEREFAEQKEAKLEEERRYQAELDRRTALKEQAAQKKEATRVTSQPASQTTVAEKPQAKTSARPTTTKTQEPEEEIELMEEEELSEGTITTSQRIAEMNVGDRIKLAKFGTREERMLLIRETNKLVALAAVTSPKMTEDEVEQVARMKNLIDDVLREIGKNREYMKSPSIRRALLENPRTPIGISLDLIKHVTERELGDLAKNRNIPETIRTTALRMVKQRMQRKETKGKH
ncbi:hypothetical protein JXQ70_15060 [bacterium]|nr:hypothetical protein [bacterium]